jgi:hypothetical protein
MPRQFVIETQHPSSPSGVAYLMSVTMEDGEWKILYTFDPDQAMTWPHAAKAREFKERDDMPRGLGRVVALKHY